jgi:hypothetical protein
MNKIFHFFIILTLALNIACKVDQKSLSTSTSSNTNNSNTENTNNGNSNNNLSIDSFSSNNLKVTSGANVVLSFNIKNASSAILNPGNINIYQKSNVTVAPTSTTTYTISAFNMTGSIQKNLTIEVGAIPNIDSYSVPSFLKNGHTATLLYYSTGAKKVILNPGNFDITSNQGTYLSPSTTTDYTIVASNDFGQVTQNFKITVFDNISKTTPSDNCHNDNDSVSFTNTKYVSDYGAVPNTGIDQTVAIQKALDALVPGDRLLFSPGVYLHNKSLNINKSNVVIEGNKTELRGNNPDDQAIWIRYSDVTVRNFIISINNNGRKGTPWAGGISSYAWNSGGNVLKNIKIINNILVPVNGIGVNYEMGSGIFIYNTQNYLVANNMVIRSYADGIHNTHFSSNGRIIHNIVRETGDDGIAVVSYLDKNWRTQLASNPNYLSTNYDGTINSNILIFENNVSGTYWGRGITVVGGKNVTIEKNDISKIVMAAGLYITRESSYETTGVKNVLALNNTISNIQNLPADFLPSGSAYVGTTTKILSGYKSGHGSIEIYGQMSEVDYNSNGADKALLMENIQLENNLINGSRSEGIRIGVSGLHQKGVNIQGNTIKNQGTGKSYIFYNQSALDLVPYCSGNLTESGPYISTYCTSQYAKYNVTGFSCYL